MTRPVLLWFRDDLRLADNPALAAAHGGGRPLLPLYILDEESPGIRPLGGAARWWLHHSLDLLAARLSALGAPLLLRRGRAGPLLRELVARHDVAAVHWNRVYDPPAAQRDRTIESQLRSAGVAVLHHSGNLLAEPGTLTTRAGEPYRVFTPFWKALRRAVAPAPALPVPDRLQGVAEPPAGDALEDWRLLPREPDWAGGLREAWRPGEPHARDRLTRFLAEAVERYPADRDRPDRAGTSRLSPHLRFGELAVARAWHAAPEGDAGEAYRRELGWRDFCAHLLHHWPTLPTANWREEHNRFPWRSDAPALRAWQRGRTGYPLVDAGMRELWATGWMHNRVRMVTASFLVKHLLIDWRAGERWFWDTLVDADPANNPANWQWVAGSGADAAPYFRIFNPQTQRGKLDPDESYVRRWLPELGSPGYPAPLVEHRAARERALAAWRRMRGGEA